MTGPLREALDRLGRAAAFGEYMGGSLQTPPEVRVDPRMLRAPSFLGRLTLRSGRLDAQSRLHPEQAAKDVVQYAQDVARLKSLHAPGCRCMFCRKVLRRDRPWLLSEVAQERATSMGFSQSEAGLESCGCRACGAWRRARTDAQVTDDRALAEMMEVDVDRPAWQLERDREWAVVSRRGRVRADSACLGVVPAWSATRRS